MENIITKNFVEAAKNLYKEGVDPDNEVAEEVLRMSFFLERKDTPYTFLKIQSSIWLKIM